MTPQELREFDAWIGENVFGMHKFENQETNLSLCDTCGKGHGFEGHYHPDWTAFSYSLPRYTTDATAAMMVLEKCAKKRTAEGYDVYRPDVTLCISAPHPDWDNKWVIMSDASGTEVAKADALPLAICLFAKQLFSK